MTLYRHIVLLVSCCLAAAAGEVATSPMVPIKGGAYQRPLEKGGRGRVVADFQMDVRQVTNTEFLAFVIAHPEWQRSQVKRIFADQGYLSKWSADTELGPKAPLDAPVVCVSWHAARAFLKSAGKRLPTVDEWEFVARADAKSIDASKDAEFKARILDWYARPEPAVLPVAGSQSVNLYGVSGMHGIVWEWTSNFVSAMTSGEARADGTLSVQQFCGGGGADPNQATEYASFMRMAFRSSLKGDFCLPGLGFRGAKDAQSPTNPKP
ncbi:MAG: formylglycine-generating enzyme family protein [Luteolibacter sp.]